MNIPVRSNLKNSRSIKKVLFACVHNSGRSQMAEALFNHYAAGKAIAFSAGTRPACHTDRNVVEVMNEMGIDIRAQRPKKLTLQMVDDADKVIAIGCGAEDVCPGAFVTTENWQLEDPEGKPVEKVREIRKEIEARVKKLIEEIYSLRPFELVS